MTRVAVLGTGIMGAGMARSLIRAGLDVTVWNRSVDKARPLGEDGARVATDAADAVREADVVVTMLYGLDSVTDVIADVWDAFGDALWVQSSTVGVDGAQQLARLADDHGVAYLDAPVLGTRAPAEQGALTVLVGGPERLRPTADPVFDAIGSTTVWVGEKPGDGHRLKLVANSWVLSLVAGTGQAIAAAQGLGLDPRLFLALIENGPLSSGYAQTKGDAMITGSTDVSFALDGARKDAGLIAAALDDAGVSSGLVRAVDARLAAASEAGYGELDMAAIVHGFGGADRET